MTDEPTAPDEPTGQDDPMFSASTASITGIAVIVVIAAVAAVILLFPGDDDQVVSGDAPTTTAPTTMLPTEPEPVEPTPPAGADSALVGLSELEVRERYPIVRLVEVDGEPLAVTMDLQFGRINLAVADGVVVGTTTEGCEELNDEVPSWQQQACNPDPAADGPNTFGKLLAGPDGASLTLEVGTDGDEYYQGMTVTVDETTILRDTTGAPIAADDLRPDDVVWIWTGECAESFPVQCSIQALVVDRPAG
jgi:hypothetical protein